MVLVLECSPDAVLQDLKIKDVIIKVTTSCGEVQLVGPPAPDFILLPWTK